MNKAFTREIDDVPPAQQERPVSSTLNLVTPRGAELIKQQIAAIENKLAAEVDPVIKSEWRRELRYWLARHSSMQMVAQNSDTAAVVIGRRATILKGSIVMAVTIVGEDESDPRAGLIAWTAPLARAIIGAKVGDQVDLEFGLDETVTILAISGNEYDEP
jgi:transcription elongation factor GreB